MNGEDVKVLMDRVEKLESQNKWMRIAFLVICMGLIGIFVVGAGNITDEIRAKKFVLVDENGKVRAELGDFPRTGGWFGLRLWDENGKVRAVLGASSVGSTFSLRDENDKSRLSLDFSSNSSLFKLKDENDKERAMLGATSFGSWLSLKDENGKEIFRAP